MATPMPPDRDALAGLYAHLVWHLPAVAGRVET